MNLLRAVVITTIVSCATGRPAPLPEQMPQGRKICAQMCHDVGREYEEYRYDGNCVCKPAARFFDGD